MGALLHFDHQHSSPDNRAVQADGNSVRISVVSKTMANAAIEIGADALARLPFGAKNASVGVKKR
jgi:hypothetical protein